MKPSDTRATNHILPTACVLFLAVFVAGCGAPPEERPEPAGSQPVTGPAFDCAEASGQVEELICDDAELAALDRRMDEVYVAALETWPADIGKTQRTLQRGWIKGRNDCWKAEDVRDCVQFEYRSRIVELQIQSGQLTAPRSIGYECEEGEEKPFFAAYYEETDPPSAVITYGDDQAIAFVAPSASGSRYTAPNLEFWEHRGEATVEWFGVRLVCRPKVAPPAAAAQRISLGGTGWKLLRFQSMDDTTLEPSGDETYSLTFESDGSLIVQAGCNKGRGTWSSTDNVTLDMGPVSSTRVACPSELQNRFLRDLGDIRSYVTRDENLYLSLKFDGGIYAFEPVDGRP